MDQFINDLFLLDLQVATCDATLTANGQVLVIKTLQESWQQLGSHDSCKERNFIWVFLQLDLGVCWVLDLGVVGY